MYLHWMVPRPRNPRRSVATRTTTGGRDHGAPQFPEALAGHSVSRHAPAGQVIPEVQSCVVESDKQLDLDQHKDLEADVSRFIKTGASI